MKIESYLNKLEDIHNCHNYNESIDITELCSNIKNSLNLYESFIPDFFSHNGDAENIKAMYKELKDNTRYYSEKTVDCIDINKSLKIYEEYNEGMMEFVNDIIHSYNYNENSITESVEYENKLSKAKKSDKVFLQSLFGGENNKPEPNVLTEAVKNIEFLIDFIPQIKNMKSKCTTIIESVDYNSNDYLIENSLKLLFESVDNYCYESIKNVINVYSLIDEEINKPKHYKWEKPTYQLF